MPQRSDIQAKRNALGHELATDALALALACAIAATGFATQGWWICASLAAALGLAGWFALRSLSRLLTGWHDQPTGDTAPSGTGDPAPEPTPVS